MRGWVARRRTSRAATPTRRAQRRSGEGEAEESRAEGDLDLHVVRDVDEDVDMAMGDEEGDTAAIKGKVRRTRGKSRGWRALKGNSTGGGRG